VVAGGSRAGEESDYGLTDALGIRARPRRSSLERSRPHAPRAQARPATDLMIDRDLSPRGQNDVINGQRKEFADLTAQGYEVHFRTAGTGKTTATWTWSAWQRAVQP